MRWWGIAIAAAVLVWAALRLGAPGRPGDAAVRAPGPPEVGVPAAAGEPVVPALLDTTPRTAIASQQEAVERRAPVVRGVVRMPDGRPCADAEVRFQRVWRGRLRLDRVRTGADGRFAFEPREPEARGDLLATVAGHTFAPAAATDVGAGDGEMVLGLGPPATVELVVRDQHGVALEPSRVSFHWMLAGVTHEDRDRSARGLRWTRSPVPFRIHLGDPRIADAWFGPFAPDEVGAVLTLEVARHPIVRGRVTHADEPVARAEVVLERAAAGDAPAHALRARTDERGEFLLCVAERGTFRTAAFHETLGSGTGPVLELDGARDLDGLELELTARPCEIVGRVRLPSGRAAREVNVLLDGTRLRSLRADGSFRLPGLAPGRHALRVVPGRPDTPEDTWGWRANGALDWLAFDLTYSVDLAPGATHAIEIDVAAPPPVRLAGSIDVGVEVRDATGFGDYEPTGVVLDHGDGARAAQGALRADGSFDLGAREPGPKRLLAHLSLQTGTDQLAVWSVHDELELGIGTNAWRLVAAPGALRLHAPDDLDLDPAPTLHWREGAREIDVRASRPATDGSVLYRLVPPGTVRFSLVPGGTEYAAVVRPGETTAFRFPDEALADLRAAFDLRTTGLLTPSYETDGDGGY